MDNLILDSAELPTLAGLEQDLTYNGTCIPADMSYQ